MTEANSSSSEVESLHQEALTGNPVALKKHIAFLAPIVKSQVARTLYKHRGNASASQIRTECEDLTQETFVYLFEKNAKVLRSWDPERGLSLPGFIRLVSTRCVLAKLRSKRSNPWSEQTVENEIVAGVPAGGQSAEDRSIAKSFLVAIIDGLREKLSPQGFHLFQKIFVEEVDIDKLSTEENMSPTALYTWKSRIKSTIQKLHDDLVQETEDSTHTKKKVGQRS